MENTLLAEKQRTAEQIAIIQHPLGRHAKVLAVAGSGKTTTMVLRIKYLVEECGVDPRTILTLMFNTDARESFQRSVDQHLPEGLRPRVHNYHSFAYEVIQKAVSEGLVVSRDKNWVNDYEEESDNILFDIVRDIEKRFNRVISYDTAKEAIGLWKASLIPPDRAGFLGNEIYVEVYKTYEQRRMELNAITFDDYIPLALAILQSVPVIARQYSTTYQYIIVDEYQDVNYGQQCLLEWLAGDHADVMVVGDDDQTIYEWRGARPDYILSEFEASFSNKPIDYYELSNTFRFGPMIAQSAFNSISLNEKRASKVLLSNDFARMADVRVFETNSQQTADANRDVANEIVRLVKREDVPPADIIVLGRTYSQLNSLQSELIGRNIPFYVDGQIPFYEREENKVLLNYLRLALGFYTTIETEEQLKILEHLLLDTANHPNRKLSRAALTSIINEAYRRRSSLGDALDHTLEGNDRSWRSRELEQLREYFFILHRAHHQIKTDPPETADSVLTDIIEGTEYLKSFDNMFGPGSPSLARKSSAATLLRFAQECDEPVADFIRHVEKLDTKRGAPPEQCIKMTTVFKAKGLEYDYVIMPDCVEGFMPVTVDAEIKVYDKDEPCKMLEFTHWLERERRLFYVGLTRAKKEAFISTYHHVSGFSNLKHEGPAVRSRFLDEAQFPQTRSIIQSIQNYEHRPEEEHARLTKSIQSVRNPHPFLQTLGRYAEQTKMAVFSLIRDLFLTAKPEPATPQQPPQQPPQQRRSAWDDVED